MLHLLLIGDSEVGKTSILKRFSNDTYYQSTLHTIGIDFKFKTTVMNGKKIKLQIWDTAGQERFHAITSSYYRKADGIALVYDITNTKSFERISLRLRDIHEKAPDNVSLILLGNKCDLENKRTVSRDAAEQVASDLAIPFRETSAMENINIDRAFLDLVESILKKKAHEGFTNVASDKLIKSSGDGEASNLPANSKYLETLMIQLILIGDSGVGKTCILKRYVGDTFQNSTLHTFGVDFKFKRIVMNGEKIDLQIWDTAGQERFNSITASYYRNADGIALVYDITKYDSFEIITQRMRDIRENAPENVSMILLGNKSDIDEERTVSREAAEQVASDLSIPFMEISAKENINIDQAFRDLVDIILNKKTHDDATKLDSATVDLQASKTKGCCKYRNDFTVVYYIISFPQCRNYTTSLHENFFHKWSAFESESLLHTVTFEGLGHHHAVTKEYNFAIPLMHKECFCECESTERCNAKSHAFTTFPGEHTGGCYRTLFSHQSNTSCASSSQLGSNLCCELSFKPYENKMYMAFKLEEHPIALAIFKYAAYNYSGNSWTIENQTSIGIPLNGRSQKKKFGAQDLLEIDVSGTISRQLKGGIYFTQLNQSGQTDGIRKEHINKFNENNPNNLGWYRQNESNGHFYISKWRSVLKNVFDARVENCLAQEYTYSFDAEFFAVDEMPIDFKLPPYVEEQHHWIESAAFSNDSMNQVIVSYKEGTNLHVGLHASNASAGNLFFLHNSSHIDSFNGSIIFDAQSRHYLNIFVHGASGILHGRIHAGDSEITTEIHSFTIYVHEVAPTNRSFIIRLPATVDKKGMFTCMTADE
ncbi:hypothetical protein PRIPAC_83852 [Pristionchus pacificus]|uniref:ADP ribosylation factor n=1 Tax=Pristionchus pacificus TaxID=54126 RepID=A0A2A6BSZ6_PRIPA|nr:hypothetical protein PRIPAC_83852 [Pristionchus pacificus]|eukprot:PDM69024.1 ADP ribosylation factor [Pristionchus pacificus]